MKRFLALRLLNTIPVLWGISFLVFLSTYLIPGDPAEVMLGPRAPQSAVIAIRAQLGLDQPFPVRYIHWLNTILHGDLGASYLSGESVGSLLARAFPVTLELTLLALGVALLISVPTAIAAALRRGTRIDAIATTAGFVGMSIPSFWLGILLIYAFAVTLQWLPATGYVSWTQDPVLNLEGMILPAFTLGLFISTQFMRYLRTGVLDVLERDYVTTARAKGLRERVVISRHVVRNALIPFVTVVGLQTGYLLSGAVVIEQVFALPGMGRLALNALFARDYAVVTGSVLVIALLFVLLNLVVDVLYSVLDPRTRVGGIAAA